MPHFSRLCLISSLIALAACATPSPEPAAEGPVRADPDAVAGDYLQGRFAASQQEYDKAADAFSRAAARDAEPGLAASAFRYALATGDLDRAEALAEGLVGQIPAEGLGLSVQEGFEEADLPRLTLIAGAIGKKEYEKAADLLADDFETSLARSIAHLLSVWVTYGEEGGDAAAERLANPPDGAFTGFDTLHAALLLDAAGEERLAAPTYARALSGPAAVFAAANYAGFRERTESREDALEAWQALSQGDGLLRRAGRIGVARLGKPLDGESREFIRMAKKTRPAKIDSAQDGAAAAFLHMGWTGYERAVGRKIAMERAGFGSRPAELEMPLALAQLAVSVDPELSAAHYIIGAILAENEQYDAAAAAYKRVPPSSWFYNYAMIDRADAFVRLDRQDDAIDLLGDYLKHDPLAPDVWTKRADLLRQADRMGEAVEAASRAIEVANALSSEETRGDNLWRFYFARGTIYADMDRWYKAEADLVEALSLAPENPILLNYLGYSYVERGEKLDEALAMIEEALAARPSSGSITDSLGWAYYQLGRYEEAVRYLERAVELEPGNATITDHLGDAYWQAGRRLEARFEWRRVLEIDDLETDLRLSVEEKIAGASPQPGELADAGDR